ncbi:MAG: hypothetical protein J7M24_05140, partial [Candidatus Latescibacteria bacterium]|nr:hypothetical protein [Candidatus Latescibacterota bacterium]
GTQSAPFISPALFESFFLERYRALVKRYHEHGYHFMLHSCGRINDLVDSFIDVGVDVMNMQQPRAYGIDEIGERFAGRIAFLTTVDIQSTLPSNDPSAIREEAHELVRKWGTDAGGFVVFNYGDPEGINVKDEMTGVMFEAFKETMWYS